MFTPEELHEAQEKALEELEDMMPRGTWWGIVGVGVMVLFLTQGSRGGMVFAGVLFLIASLGRWLHTAEGRTFLRGRVAAKMCQKSGGIPVWAVECEFFPYVREMLGGSDLTGEELAEVMRRAGGWPGSLEELVAEVRR